MLNLDKFFKECEESPVSLALQKTKPLGNGAYKILCEVSRIDYSAADLKKAVSKTFNNKVSLVENTVTKKDEKLLGMIVKANVRSMAFDPENLPAGKKMVTASICTDVNDNSIWEVVGTGKEKRLVLKADEGFDKIFEHSNRICTAAVLDKPVEVLSGDYISFYSPKDNAIKAGFALVSNDDEIEVIDREDNTFEVDPEEVIESADLTKFDKNPVQAALDNNELDKIRDYISILFKDTEFFNTLDELLKADRKLNEEDRFPHSTMASTNLDEIKQEIKDFLINDAISDLRNELLNSKEPEEEVVEEEIIPEEGNFDGDIDFASEEEIEEYEDPAAETLEEKVEAPEEAPIEEISVDLDEEEPVLDDEDGELLDEEEIEVTSEEELDDGEFEDVEVKQVSEEDIANKLKEIMQ